VHKPLSQEKAIAILATAPAGRLATCKDNVPYVVPVNHVYHQGKLYFHCAPTGRKLENIAANPRVCFQVDDEATLLPRGRACEFTAHYYSAMVAGTARLVNDPEERLTALRALMAKHDPQGLAPELTLADVDTSSFTVVEIVPEEISGVDHGRL
jgi:uncharacterized protein